MTISITLRSAEPGERFAPAGGMPRVALLRFPSSTVRDEESAAHLLRVATEAQCWTVEVLPVGSPEALSRLGGGNGPRDIAATAGFDALILPASFQRSPVAATACATVSVRRLVRAAPRTAIVAATEPEARRAHLLLRPLSGLSAGAFGATGNPGGRDATRTVADGAILWAIGQDAPQHAIAGLASFLTPASAA